MATVVKPITTVGAGYTNGTSFSGQTLGGGDIIQFAAGTHRGYQYFDGYQGTSKENPIIWEGATSNPDDTIVDCDNVAGWIGLGSINCDHVLVRNMTVMNSVTGLMTILMQRGSWVFENIKIRNSGSQGIAVHNDSGLPGNPSLWRSGFPPDGVSSEYVEIINCDIDGTIDEGIYLGASNPHRYYPDGNQIYQQSLIRNCIVKNNVIRNTGADGAQMTCINGVYDSNTLIDVATNNSPSHNSGITAAFGHCEMYNNYIENVTGSGMFFANTSGKAFNNTIKGCGTGLTMNHRQTNAYPGHWIYNNTITECIGWCIVNYNTHNKYSRLENNIFHLTPDTLTPGNNEYFQSGAGGATIVENNNLEVNGTADLAALNFTDYANGDLSIQAGSTAEGGGLNLSSYDAKSQVNIAGNQRPKFGAWNRGSH